MQSTKARDIKMKGMIFLVMRACCLCSNYSQAQTPTDTLLLQTSTQHLQKIMYPICMLNWKSILVIKSSTHIFILWVRYSNLQPCGCDNEHLPCFWPSSNILPILTDYLASSFSSLDSSLLLVIFTCFLKVGIMVSPVLLNVYNWWFVVAGTFCLLQRFHSQFCTVGILECDHVSDFGAGRDKLTLPLFF